MRDIRPTNRPMPKRDDNLPPAIPALPAGRPLKKVSARDEVPVSENYIAGSATNTADVDSGGKQFVRRTVSTNTNRPWRIGKRERMIMSVFFLLVMVTGLLAVVIFLPKADIRLAIRTAPLLVDEELTLQATADATSGSIPGTAFFREVQVNGIAPVTSTRVIGEKAAGTVQIINRSTSEQKIKSESRLVTDDGQLFYMQDSVTLPPGPSQVNVNVVAAEAGEAGNIKEQRLNFAALDPSSQSLVYAEVVSALTGGSGETVPIVREADLTAAHEAAGNAARGQIEADIREELPEGWALLDESWETEIISFDTTATLDSQELEIPYQARVTVRVMGYATAALEEHLREALESRMDDQYMLFPGPISFSKTVKQISWEESTAQISARVTHTTIPELPLETLREKILGRPEAEAKQYLEGLPGVRAVELTLSPFWVTSVPRIESRVNLDLQSERQP